MRMLVRFDKLAEREQRQFLTSARTQPLNTRIKVPRPVKGGDVPTVGPVPLSRRLRARRGDGGRVIQGKLGARFRLDDGDSDASPAADGGEPVAGDEKRRLQTMPRKFSCGSQSRTTPVTTLG
jgi:hypothetical protein